MSVVKHTVDTSIEKPISMLNTHAEPGDRVR